MRSHQIGAGPFNSAATQTLRSRGKINRVRTLGDISIVCPMVRRRAIYKENNVSETQVATREKKDTRQMTVAEMFESLAPQIAKAAPSHITAERLQRIFLTAMRQNPKLMKCDRLSLMGSIMLAAQLGLEPNTPLGQCYLIPYGDQAQFQLGYKGLIELAYRSGHFKRISAEKVDSADKFSYELGTDAFIKHIPADEPSGEIVKYYAVYELANGGKDFKIWSREKAHKHGKRYSKSFSKPDSPWQTSFDSMAMKSVVIDLLRLAPKSAESPLAQAVAHDNGMPRADIQGEDIALSVDFDEVRGKDEESTE